MIFAQTDTATGAGRVERRTANARETNSVGAGALVFVQREWNDWHTASVRVLDLEDVHWLQPCGARRRLIHAYIPCTKLQSGNIAHQCDLLSAPHRLLVCILKSHTVPSIYDALSREADEGERHPAPAVRA